MDRTSIWVFTILVLLIIPLANTIQENVKLSLVTFMNELSSGTVPRHPNWGWNTSSDPCIDKWIGVNCTGSQQVRKIVLEGLNFNGTLDAASLCTTTSLQVLSLKGNKIVGLMPKEIGSSKRLTHFFVSGNQFSGAIPGSIFQMMNLKRFDISNNSFSGQLPDMSPISGLLSFFAQDNQFSGPLPNLNFLILVSLNVSNNNFNGPIPDVKGKFNADSFFGNPGLCGKPLQNVCPPSLAPLPPPSPPPLSQPKSKRSLRDKIIVYSGYSLLVLVVLFFLVFKIVKKYKRKKERNDAAHKSSEGESNSTGNTNTTTGESRSTRDRQENRLEFSITSVESGLTSSSLVLLSSSVVESLQFEELLRAPAELLSRGKHGGLYKASLGNGLVLAVKRIKGWAISSEEFKVRMQRIERVKHPRILAPIALYCSKQEKLLVYQYQSNGSLFSLLHGLNGNFFHWGSRLRVAAIVAKALAFMHQELREYGIAHGNLKSTNILFDNNMEPCISEYGLMVVQDQEQSILSQTDNPRNNDLGESSIHKTFSVDVYGFGVILLELLTGKLVQNNTNDLAKCVQSVFSEGWTAEVLDKALIAEGVNEERMVNLLQLALKCINPSPFKRPSMNQILMTIHRIRVEDDSSNSSDP